MTVLPHGPEPGPAALPSPPVVPGAPRRRREVPSVLATAFGWCAPQVSALAEADPCFEAFLLRANRLQFHLIALAVAHALPCFDIPPPDARRIAGLLRLRKVGAVAEALCGASPPGLRGALWKLPRRLLFPRGYRRLVELLNEPEAARLLHHAPRITPMLLTVLAKIDPALRRPRLVREIKSLLQIEELEYAACALQHLGAAPDRTAALALMGAADSWRAIARRLLKAFEGASGFPSPFPVSGRLQPLDNIRAVRQAGREFGNCLQRFELDYAWRPPQTFCVWRGEEPAVVALIQDPMVGWRVGEIAGHGNAPVSSATTREILQALAPAGIRRWGYACHERWLSRALEGGGE